MIAEAWRVLSSERGRKALLLVTVVLTPLLAWPVVVDTPNTFYHFERAYPTGSNKEVYLVLRNLIDTNVTLSFVNDTGLMYRIDVECYEHNSDARLEYESGKTLCYVFLFCIGRLRSVNVVLSSCVTHSLIGIYGTGLNVTVDMNNGAVTAGNFISVQMRGIFRLRLRDDTVTHAVGGCRVEIGHGSVGERPDLALLDIDLPDGYEGSVGLDTRNLSFLVLDGWYYRGGNHYSTVYPLKEPLVYVGCSAKRIVASLRD
jgi:hypothetical protein